MIKLNNRGAEIFKENFHRVKKLYWNKPFQRASIFQKSFNRYDPRTCRYRDKGSLCDY